MLRSRLAAVVALVVIPVVLCGCGGKSSDADQITSLTRELAAAAKGKQWKAVCNTMSTKAQAQIAVAGAIFGGGDCAQTMKKAFALDDSGKGLGHISPDQFKVSAIKVRGDHATAQVTPSSDGDSTTRYVREDGEWRIDADLDEDSSSTTSNGAAAEDRTPEVAAPKLDVAERGFSRASDSTSFGVVVRNPSGQDAVDVKIQVNLIGADGNVISTENHELAGVSAGEEAAVGGDSDTNGERVRRLEVAVTADSGAGPDTVKLPTVTSVKVSHDEFGMSVRAQVRNTLDKPLSSITDAFAVLRDANGAIVGGMSGYPESDLAPGARAAIKLSNFSDMPNVATADVTVDGETG